jgi:hypothetical protein
MFTAALPGNVLLLGADGIENIVSLLLLRFVYRAVAQQRADEMHYNTNKLCINYFLFYASTLLK